MHRVRYLIGTIVLVAAVCGAWWFVRVLRNLDDRPGMPLRVEFRDARGLRAGADVRFRGVNVGTVRTVTIATDGEKAIASILLEPAGAAQACVNSTFWIVTPRFGGITGGASGLDTLVRDAYVTFQTPRERGSPLVAGSLLAGREKPPAAADPETLDEIEHGDLLMSVLVPENHGLRPGSAVIFRGQQTGDVRSVELAPDGSHVVVELRIARRHRQTVTDRCQFWVARPALTGGVMSGVSLTDAAALLSPYVSYYGDPGKGAPVQDGFRVAAQSTRPAFEPAAVPIDALKQVPVVAAATPPDGVIVVRVVYDAIERDTWSADDPVHGEGSGLLVLSRDGRPIVLTARSIVDGMVMTTDAFGRAPDIDNEEIRVMLPDGGVLRAGRVWVHPAGQDLAALMLEGAPPSLRGTAEGKLRFTPGVAPGAETASVRFAGPDGTIQPAVPSANAPANAIGGAVVAGDVVTGILVHGAHATTTVVPLDLVPPDLRPR